MSQVHSRSPVWGARSSARSGIHAAHDGASAAQEKERYFRLAARFPVLGREELHALAERYVKTGDRAAAERLVTANLRLVMRIARRYAAQMPGHWLDLIQEGNAGLLQAVRHFDPSRKIAFTTYAAWWIRAYVIRYQLENWRLVRVGGSRRQREIFFNLSKARQRLEARGIEATPERIATELGVPAEGMAELEAHLRSSEVQLDGAREPEEEQGGPLDLAAPSELQPDAEVEQLELRARVLEQLARFRKNLEPREAALVAGRWLSEAPTTLNQLGGRFGVSRERMRQLEVALMKRFQRQALEELQPA